jgi:16S rRNA (uracil1498-N3)-methyltransferase
MPRFFVDQNQIENEYITITGEDAHHISRSLRMAQGEHITVSDMEKYEYDCVLEIFSDNCVKAKIIDKYISTTEPPVRIHLYQALPKGDKLDLIIQKSVECGVYDITPFESERCVVKVKGDSEDRKNDRRNKIALEAAKQCGRGIIPKVKSTLTFTNMLKEASNYDAVLFCYEGEGTEPIGKVLKTLKQRGNINDVAVIIGSEGGFSPAEANEAISHGFSSIGLGKRILRAETAAIFSITCIAYEFELV